MRPSQQPDLRIFSEMSSSWLKGLMQIFPGARPLPPPSIELNHYLYKNVGKQNVCTRLETYQQQATFLSVH